MRAIYRTVPAVAVVAVVLIGACSGIRPVPKPTVPAAGGPVPVREANRLSSRLGPPLKYSVVHFGMVEGRYFHATALNDAGVVVGYPHHNTTREGPPVPGYAWRDGRFERIGNLPQGREFVPVAINNRGDILGTSVQNRDARILLWSDGRMWDVASFTLHGNASIGTAFLNNRGEVVYTDYGRERPRAFLWTKNGGRKALKVRGQEDSRAFALGDQGDVVLAGLTRKAVRRVVLYRNGQERPLDAKDNWKYYDSKAINNRGQIVGTVPVQDPGFTSAAVPTHGFLWHDGTHVEIGVIGPRTFSTALDINDHGDIIGSFDGGRPFLWREGVIHRLDQKSLEEAGGDQFRPRAINNRGQIIGYGTVSGADSPDSYLLTPEVVPL